MVDFSKINVEIFSDETMRLTIGGRDESHSATVTPDGDYGAAINMLIERATQEAAYRLWVAASKAKVEFPNALAPALDKELTGAKGSS